MNIKLYLYRYLITSACFVFLANTINARSPHRRRNQIKQALQSSQPISKPLAIADNLPQDVLQNNIDTSSTLEKESNSKLLQEIVQQPFTQQEETSTKEDEELKSNPDTVLEPQNQARKDDETINEDPVLDQDAAALADDFQEQLRQEDEAAKDVLQTLAEKEEAEEEEERVELQFEDADLTNFIKQIEELFEITFITDESIQPLKEGAKPIKGNTITFKTHKPLTKQEAWDLLTTFLEIAGFTMVPQADPSIYRIQTLLAARKAPIQAYIGVDADKLPDNDQIIRYVYFVQNSTSEAMKSIVDTLKSKDATLLELKEQKAFILTDKAYNIKTLMKIIKELDKVSTPQAMSVIKLRNADATDIKALYDSLIGVDEKTPYRPFNTRRPPTSLYFPENTRIIAETRTNSLILLGTKDAIEKIEEFIKKYIDVELDQPYSPLHTYQLKYADATTIATIMTDVTKFGHDPTTGQPGGVRGQDKYLQPMAFTPEKETNRLIIRGQYEDYLRAKEVIDELDKQQPQVSIEILILSLSIKAAREFGTQLRSKVPGMDGLIGKNVKFQTSGLRAGGNPKGIVENTDAPSGALRLLGNMLELVTNASAGNTIISLGQDIYNVWGVLQVLQTATNAQVISNPYLTATNKTEASISVGETRRLKTGEVITTGSNTTSGSNPTFSDDTAALIVNIKPQINSDGMIVLDLTVDISEFTVPATVDENASNISTKLVKTQITVADKEVIALGGLVRNTILDSMSKTPILGDIPILGWLFKNKRKQKDQDNLLILISTNIINPEATSDVNRLTQERIKDYQGTLEEMQDVSEKRDPIHKLFFAGTNKTDKAIEDFIFERDKNNKRSLNRRRRKRNAKKQNSHEPSISEPPSASLSIPSDKSLEAHSAATTIEKKETTNKSEYLQSKIKDKKRSRFSLTNLLSPKDSGSGV